MELLKLAFVIVAIVLLASSIDAKKKKHKSSNGGSGVASKTKTKTKWSTSTDNGPNGANSMVATEEHGYYVKRTFLPLNASAGGALPLRSPPFLAIPIAWFDCDGGACAKGNSGAINGNANAISADGFLCDDDCTEPYKPICGRTAAEVAVFYNLCKLNVAKCRTHGQWTTLGYDECKQTYSKEVEYTEKKFRSSPFFWDNSTTIATTVLSEEGDNLQDKILAVAVEALNEIGTKLTVAEEANSESGSGSGSGSSSDSGSGSSNSSDTGYVNGGEAASISKVDATTIPNKGTI